MKDEDASQLVPQYNVAIVCKDMDKDKDMPLHNYNNNINSTTNTNTNTNSNSTTKCDKTDEVTVVRPPKPLGERSKAVWRQQLMVFLGNSGVIGSGMIIAMPAVTLAQLTNPELDFTLNSNEASWFASINNMACPIGGLLVSYFLDRIGRKNTILLTNLIGFLSWLLLITCFQHTERDWIYAQLLIARALGGVMIGMFLSPVGVYSAEISLPRIRGRLILGTSIALACGILIMYVLGYFIRSNIVLISTICGCYQFVSTLMVFPMPESPSWLLQKGRTENARRSLKYFRGLKRKSDDCVQEFETELAEMKVNADNSRNTAASESLLQAIRRPEVYKPVFLIIGFFGFQQACGVVVIIVYAVQIAQRAGVTIDPVLVAVMLGVARIIMTFFMSTIFERWGRKPSGMFSAFGMGLCMLLLAAGGWWPKTVGTWSWLPVVCIVAHIVFSTMGMLTLPFLMISEVFPQRARGSASGISVFFGMILAFIMLKIYPNMEEAFGTANLFGFYAGVSFLAVAFIWCFVPETRGRTLLEIEEYWRTGKGERANNLKDVELTEVFLKK
ncbi:facilitated trehalose transporter Tret1 [Scaptodrosophila lebanonensis]|uniref:Facilitated trehalose transporter Tret1 n=1 Tax=Drosophila lebanonensis TaxID=7225 RepID=A0A6J2TGM1_DROLE|nr:facilitated trehalose transporter Tret1 [Scaptodrosophila lebanonensis]